MPPSLQPLIILFVILAIAVVAVGVYYAWLAAKKRREELAALCEEFGWRFAEGDDHGHDDMYEHFEIFRRGHSRKAFNRMIGTIEVAGRRLRAKAGDFRYRVTSGSGKNRRTTTYTFSYLIAHLPWDRVPALLIRPEGFFDKVAGAFGFDDIDFESVEFSKRFYVKGSDKKFAYDVLHPRMMEFLLEVRPPMIDVENGQLCFSGGSKRWSAAEFRSAIEIVDAFLTLWPEHLVQTLE